MVIVEEIITADKDMQDEDLVEVKEVLEVEPV